MQSWRQIPGGLGLGQGAGGLLVGLDVAGQMLAELSIDFFGRASALRARVALQQLWLFGVAPIIGAALAGVAYSLLFKEE